MHFQYLHEVLRLLIAECDHDPEAFVSIFDNSEAFSGFSFSFAQKKFTHFSKSLPDLVGYNQDVVLRKNDFISKIIHPHDKAVFIDYIFCPDNEPDDQDHQQRFPVKEMKCRIHHMKGYWKCMLFFTLSFMDKKSNAFCKAGIMADEHFHTHSRTMTKNIDQFNWEDITSGKSAFMYQPVEVQISQRESEILELISEGKIAKEIATSLNISPNTVITHRKNLISKFNVRNTAQLIKKASQMMLI